MKRIDVWKPFLMLLALTLALSSPAIADDAPVAPQVAETAPATTDEPDLSAEGQTEEEEEKPKTIAELTEDAERKEGLFTIFRDTKTGKVSMLVKADQIDDEFIYFSQSVRSK